MDDDNNRRLPSERELHDLCRLCCLVSLPPRQYCRHPVEELVSGLRGTRNHRYPQSLKDTMDKGCEVSVVACKCCVGWLRQLLSLLLVSACRLWLVPMAFLLMRRRRKGLGNIFGTRVVGCWQCPTHSRFSVQRSPVVGLRPAASASAIETSLKSLRQAWQHVLRFFGLWVVLLQCRLQIVQTPQWLSLVVLTRSHPFTYPQLCGQNAYSK